MTHREKAPSSKTTAFTKSMNIDIPVVCRSHQFFIRGSCTTFFLKKVITFKTPFFVIGLFCTPQTICLNIGFL